MPEAPTQVLESYRAAVTANPNNAEAHSNLGWGYYGQKQFAEAVKAFQQALTLDRNVVDAHYGLGLTLKESGSQPGAIAEFESVAALAPQLENSVRGQMLARLAHGHINQMNVGDWGLDKELRRHEP